MGIKKRGEVRRPLRRLPLPLPASSVECGLDPPPLLHRHHPPPLLPPIPSLETVHLLGKRRREVGEEVEEVGKK